MKRDSTTKANSVHASAMKRVRVLVVGPSLDILGGQSVQAERLIHRLSNEASLHVEFLPINPRLPGICRGLQAVKYLRTFVTSLPYVLSLIIRVPQFDVVHIFSASYFSFVIAPTPAMLIAKLFGKKVLLNYHSGEAEDHLTRWPSALRTLRLADEVVVPSAFLVRVFKKFGIQSRSINNLIELDKFSFRERNELRPRFLSNRNFEAHYGVDVVLRAFAKILKQYPNAEIEIAGDGRERESLQKLAGELGLHNATFVGRVEPDEIVASYDQADIYLNGSEIDNQPLSILEAFACGLPVVTTNAGGIPDMVKHGETGLVVERGDHEALAESAICLLSDSGLANAISRNALDECHKYGWQEVREQWLDTYRQLASIGKESSPESPSKIAKLGTMSVDEIGSRLTQAFSAFLERRGWSSETTLATDKSLLRLFKTEFKPSNLQDLRDHFRSHRSRPCFEGLANREATVAEIRNRWPEAEQEIIEAADRIVAGRFDLLGFKDLNFGDPIDWHFEPVSRKRAPRVHWSRINYLDFDTAGDKKIIWELNRHQHFVKLGQAYWLTGDEKYANTFVEHIESWMEQNPPKIGINWASSLEVAFRSIAWIWALAFFSGSSAVSDKTFANILKFLHLNGRHLETYLSTYFSPNTHLTGEALGLFYLGEFLPGFKAAERWRETGQQILLEQLDRQVKPDGVYFEQSSYYHRYTVDFYTHFLLLLRQLQPADQEALQQVEEKLNALLVHLMYLTRPDGSTPLFGDDDGGRLLPLDRRASNDFRAALSNGAILFNRGDYRLVAGEFAEETLWLMGRDGARQFDQIQEHEPAEESKAFYEGGYFVMRDGWHDEANYLLFDCGPHGTGNGGHAHADALAIEMVANGRSLLVDAGTHTYTGSQEQRGWFRSSEAHNVMTIDGESSSIPAGPFSWKTMANCEVASWISERRFDYVEGRHDGYERLTQPASCQRSILFLKNDYWLLRDRVVSQGSHEAQLKFHFSPDSNPHVCENESRLREVTQTSNRPGVRLITLGPEGSWRREEAFISECYGNRAQAPVCTFSAHYEGNAETLTLMLPTRGQQRPAIIKELEAIGGRGFEIESENASDLLMVRDSKASRTETVRLASDFEWTWVRFSRTPTGAEELAELLVMNGQELKLDGKEILKSSRCLRYLSATRVGDRFRLETSEGVLDLSLPATDLESAFAEVSRRMQPDVVTRV